MNAGPPTASSAGIHWLSSRTAVVLAVILSLTAFVTDILSQHYLIISVMPYLVVVAISTWMPSRRAPYFWLSISSVLLLAGMFIKAPDLPVLMIQNRISYILVLCIIAYMASVRQQSEVQLRQANEVLEQEVARRTQELKHSNEQLQKSVRELEVAKTSADVGNNAKRRFLARMSHEFRTPLNAVLGFSDSMRQEVLGPVGNPSYLDYSNAIYESGGDLLKMVESVLVASQLESAEYTLREENIDVRSLIEEAISGESGNILAKHLDLQFQIPQELPCLRADRAAVRRMLCSLLSNAVKFSPDKAVLRITVETGAEGLRIGIHDQGPGIAPEDLELAALPFETAHGADTASKGGAGLGLSNAYGLAMLHNAELEIKKGDRCGTSAVLHFPPERYVCVEAQLTG